MAATEDPDRQMNEPELHGKGCFLTEEHEDSQNKGSLYTLSLVGMQGTLLQPQPDWARKSKEKDKDA